MQIEGHYAIWALPSQKLNLPLNVRSVGRNDVSSGWRDKVKQKWFLQLFWTVEGNAEFLVGPKRYRVKAGDIFIYRPGDKHEITAISRRWVCCWITWDHPDSQKWVEAYDLAERVNHRTKCPEWLFREVAEGLRENIPHGHRRAIQAAHGILLQASIHRGKGPRSNPLAEHARTQMDTNFRDTSLTMESLAEMLKVHRTTLFRAFQSAFGISPSMYLHNRRMEAAIAMLHGSNLRINEVADRAGFSDPNYFSRAVKLATGLTPRFIQTSTGS